MPAEQPDDPELTDAALVARAQRGDEDAFAVLYRRYRDWCVRVAWRSCRDEATAWDATHDAFAWLLRRLPTLRVDGRLSSLLYPVVRNAAATIARRNSARDRHESAAMSRERSLSPVVDLDLPRAVRESLDTLPEAQRETLLMRAVDGMSMQEIAIAMGIPVGTVKSRLHHALGALRGDDRLGEVFRS